MTKFIFTEPNVFVKAQEYLNSIDEIRFEDELAIKSFQTLFLHRNLAVNDAYWNWLHENKSEISYIEVQTEDIPFAWHDIMQVYDNNNHEIYNEYVDLIGRGLKRFHRRLKRFELDDIPINIHTLR